MFMRIDKLQIELPKPRKADPNQAAALQELLGGKFGEMSTLNNYLFQSFNFRSKSRLKPFYSLVASITAEELGHVELVTNGVNMVASGPDGEDAHGDDVTASPFADMKDIRLAASFLHAGGAAQVADSGGIPWNGSFVFSTGNVVLDLLAQLLPRVRRAPAQAARLRDRVGPLRARSAATCWCAARSTPTPTRWR